MAAFDALHVLRDPAVGDTKFFEVHLEHLPKERRPHDRFKITYTHCMSFDSLQDPELRTLLMDAREMYEKKGVFTEPGVRCIAILLNAYRKPTAVEKAAGATTKEFANATFPSWSIEDVDPWNPDWERDLIRVVELEQSKGRRATPDARH